MIRIHEALGDVAALLIVFAIALAVLMVEDEKVCDPQKDCLTVYEN